MTRSNDIPERPAYDHRSEAEYRFHRHISMWGSDAYPVRKVGNGKWIWFEFWGVQGAPTVYKTKREAFAAIQRYISILCDKAAGRCD